MVIRPRTESAVFFAASASQGCWRAAVASRPPAPVARNRRRLCILFSMPFPPLIALLPQPLTSSASAVSHRRPPPAASRSGRDSTLRFEPCLILSPQPPERNGFEVGWSTDPGRGEVWAGKDRTRRLPLIALTVGAGPVTAMVYTGPDQGAEGGFVLWLGKQLGGSIDGWVGIPREYGSATASWKGWLSARGLCLKDMEGNWCGRGDLNPHDLAATRT